MLVAAATEVSHRLGWGHASLTRRVSGMARSGHDLV